MAFGVIPTGFNAKAQADVQADLEAAFQSAFGASIDVSPESNFGQLIGIFAERYAELWEVAEATYNAFTPDGATDVAQDNLAGITGTIRRAAARSSVTLTATGTPATSLAAGRQVSALTVGTKFQTTSTVVITLANSWANTHAYVLGDRVTNSSKVYQVITAGTSAGSGGPTTTVADITDGTVHWKYLGAGTGVIDAPALSVDNGAQVGTAGTLSVIDTPVAGWSNVTNLLDATLGNAIESDVALRLRREAELHGAGRSAVDAVRAAVLKISGVTSCIVYENTTLITDGTGLPGKAIEVLVEGGTNAAVLQAVWDNKPAGIQAYGITSGSATDAEGNTQTVAFTRPTAITIWEIVEVLADVTQFPTNGADLIKDAIKAFGDTLTIGRNVTSAASAAQAFGISGVLDVTSLFIKTSSPPTSPVTIAIGPRERASFDTSRITVNVTYGTP